MVKIWSAEHGIGDPMLGEPEEVVAVDRLAFAGIAPPRLRLYPVETHLPEKLHAYTMPRTRPNSRIKDLPDIALLAGAAPLGAARLWAALEQTFEFRGTHSIPAKLPLPPTFWRAPYATMARDFELRWETLDACHAHARRFLDPVLTEQRRASWDPTSWSWRGG